MMVQTFIVILLIAVIAFAIYQTVLKFQKGGGCCGEHEQPPKSITVKDKNKAHYPYSIELNISGMTCSNCAKRVENALNTVDGVWAKVNFNQHSALVRMKQEVDVKLLCGMIAKAGYYAQQK